MKLSNLVQSKAGDLEGFEKIFDWESMIEMVVTVIMLFFCGLQYFTIRVQKVS